MIIEIFKSRGGIVSLSGFFHTFAAVITKHKKIMSIDTYKLTSMEEPTDEVLSQLMREAAEEAKQKRAEATARFFGQLKRESEKIAASC